MEVWKDIKVYEGLYQVSNYGRVKSLNYHLTKKEMVLKASPDCGGYLKVVLYKNGKRKHFLVHRLVAEAFLPNPDNLPQINHKDEDKTNNIVENLEWCDVRYNINYGTHNERVAEKLSKPVLQFTIDGRLLKEWSSASECCRNGFGKGNVAACCRGKRKSAYNFIWKYKEVV